MSTIRDIRVVPLWCSISSRHSIVGAAGEFRCSLIEVETEDRITGLGEVQMGMRVPQLVQQIVDEIKPLVVGRDSWDRRRVWNAMYRASYPYGRRGLVIGVIGAVDLALWDICGKEAGVPVYELLGGALADRVPVYASGGLEQSAAGLANECRSYVERGYRAVKIRLLESTCKDNVALAEAVREAVGPEVRLMLDCVQQWRPDPWTVADAIELARALEPLNPFWLEDPYDVNDLAGVLAVKLATNLPIAIGESLTTYEETLSYIKSGAADFIQTDIAIVGGLEAARTVATAAAAFGLVSATHVWGSGVSLAASLHFGMSTKSLAYVEHPQVENPLRKALFIEEPVFVDGQLELSRLPGLGVKLEDVTRQEYAYRT